MACIKFSGEGVVGVMCIPDVFRLRLHDGRYVYMVHKEYAGHDGYSGPAFFFDRICVREIPRWYDRPLICRAFEWFEGRGCRA